MSDDEFTPPDVVQNSEDPTPYATTGTLRGTVTDTDGTGIEEASVIATQVNGSSAEFGFTDANGNYDLGEVGTDDWVVRADRPSYVPEAQTVTVSENTTTEADFQLSAAPTKVVGTAETAGAKGLEVTNTATSGWTYGVDATLDSRNFLSSVHRVQARTAATGIEVTSESNGITVETSGENATAVRATSTAGAQNSNGLVATTDSPHPNANAVSGVAVASTGRATGVMGWSWSPDPDSEGVIGEARASTGEAVGVYGTSSSPTGYGVKSTGQLHVERDVAIASTTDFRRHAATIHNTSGSTDGDVLGLKTDATSPGSGVNFVSFVDSTGEIGAIYGSGNGSVTFTGNTADFAEYFPKADPAATFEPGQVVGLRDGEVVADTGDADAVLVVTTAPILAGNEPRDGDAEDYVPLSLVGQIPVGVSGEVDPGDELVASPAADGTAVARRTTDREAAPAVGLALGAADGTPESDGADEVLALVGAPGPGSATDPGATDADESVAALREDVAALRRENERKDERIADLEDRLAALESRVGPGGVAPADD